ncbi:MAG: hypothetical protein ACNI3C_09525 [Candidatus Marinarcus sp.]|uniref:hypothetical protein n=1 Tax=Candidatus Marinarcus sp. TaxID=3100987 RepID=UPI003AFF7482
MLINHLSQQIYNDISQTISKEAVLEKSNNVNSLEQNDDINASLPSEYIPDSQLSEKELLHRKLFETILNAFATQSLSQEERNNKSEKELEEAKQKMKDYMKEIKSINNSNGLNELFKQHEKKAFE